MGTHSADRPAGLLKERWAHLSVGGRQSLADHLSAVARLTSEHAGKFGLPNAGKLIGLLHDLGKSSDLFQNYLLSFNPESGIEPQDELRNKIDHSTSGAQCILHNLPGSHEEGTLNGILARLLALPIASHHSGLIDCLAPDGKDSLGERLRKGNAKTRYPEAWATLDAGVRRDAEALMRSPELVSELKTSVRRILKSGKSEIEIAVQTGLLARMLLSCLVDGDRTDTADFERPASAAHRQAGRYESWKRLEERLGAFLQQLSSAPGSTGDVNRVRRAVSDQCYASATRQPGLYTLTVPTGGGKTLAALRFALAHARTHRKDRVIFVSPYLSIVDQNASVVRSILEPGDIPFASVVLEHHSNLAAEGGGEHWRRKVLAENWDAPVVFTTMAQVLEALFGAGTRAVRRMHAMAGAVLVFDEVQTLPVKLVHLFNNALNFLSTHCGATAVLCTATQPLLHEVNVRRGAARLAAAPELIADVTETFRQLRRYRVFDGATRPWTHHEAAELARVEALEYGSCLVVVNTRRDALEIFKSCREHLPPEAHVAHLSTGMCPAHRTQVLADLRKQLGQNGGPPLVCVSTQLIEAGVDIDFACVLRDLAGLDSVAQAAGRCNRNGRRTQPGRVHILKLPPLPKALDDIRKGQEIALRVLGEWRTAHPDQPFPLDDPDRMRRFYELYFFARRDEMSYTVPAHEGGGRKTTLLELLGANGMTRDQARRTGTLPRRTMLLQSFKTANEAFALIGPTEGIVVPYGHDGSATISNLAASCDLEAEWQLLRQAQPYTISVYPSLLKRLNDLGAVYELGNGVRCLRPAFYDPIFGLNTEGSAMEELIV